MSSKRSTALPWLASVLGFAAWVAAPSALAAVYFLNEGPTLPPPASTISPAGVSNDPLQYVRLAGMQVFSTQFRSNVICYVPTSPQSTVPTPISDGDPPIDGFGDGCGENTQDPTAHSGQAGRPYLQDNGTFVRVDGLGSQSCLECHDQASSRSIPFTMGVGGHGGLNSTEIVFAAEPATGRSIIDVDDRELSTDPRGYAFFNGRIINPPDTFGDGGVQLVGEEMTTDLQNIRTEAMDTPYVRYTLVAKGVHFGSIECFDHIVADCDTSQVQGVNSDLVVRPFGRKGEFSTVRAFADNAFEFHSGIQPQEIDSGDPDGDGVYNELTITQLSALSVFLTTEDAPFQESIANGSPAAEGQTLFGQIGCASCHVPELDTSTPDLVLTEPPQPLTAGSPAFSQAPTVAYRTVDLSTLFPPSPDGSGIAVQMYSDLKRHNMGTKLCENASFNDRAPEIPAEGAITGGEDVFNFNCEFITAKLWGVFDSAPYLHDGRALILSTAILLHGGEAANSEAQFQGLSRTQKNDILAFLATLRNPTNPNSDVVPQP